MGDVASSHGTTVHFKGTPLGRVVSIKATRSCSRLDVTGFGSPDRVREVIAGELEPITVSVTVVGPLTSSVGDFGVLAVAFPSGSSFTFANAFIENVDVGANVGELIKSTYTFVAST